MRVSAVFCRLFIATLFLSLPADAVAPPGGVINRFTADHLANQIIVRHDSIGVTELLASANLTDAVVVGEYLPGSLTLLNLETTNLSAGDFRSAIEALNGAAGVNWAEPNYVLTTTATPNDSQFPTQWSKDNRGINAPGGAGHLGADLNLNAAWDSQTDASSAPIAIIDDSMDVDHLDLFANSVAGHRCFASPGSRRPCANGDNDPRPTLPEETHGTQVAGVAGARGNNALGIAGTAWEATLFGMKTDLTTFAIAQAIDTSVLQGARVINMSFGGPVRSNALTEALQRAEVAGVLAVAAAGNSDSANHHTPFFPANTDLPNVIAVAATRADDTIAAFSQYSATDVLLAAPGEQVLTTQNGNAYGTASGTSFAAPHVAGVAALVAAENGFTNYSDIIAALASGVTYGNALLGAELTEPGSETVHGRVSAGRLDAARAVSNQLGNLIIVSEVVLSGESAERNSALAPGDSGVLRIRLQNLGPANSAFATLVSRGTALGVVDNGPVELSVGTREEVVVDFPVRVSAAHLGYELVQFELVLDNSADSVSRYFQVGLGYLPLGEHVSESIQSTNWDEFHGYRLNIPEGMEEVTLNLDAPGDVDLLARHLDYPAHLIALSQADGGQYFVEDGTLVAATASGNETLTLDKPAAGVWHLVVVNFDQQSKYYSLSATGQADSSPLSPTPTPSDPPPDAGGSNQLDDQPESEERSGGGSSLVLLLIGMLLARRAIDVQRPQSV